MLTQPPTTGPSKLLDRNLLVILHSVRTTERDVPLDRPTVAGLVAGAWQTGTTIARREQGR
jgi:hypothetical protein